MGYSSKFFMVMCQVYEVEVLTIEVKKVIVILFYQLLIKRFTSLIHFNVPFGKKIERWIITY
jgi:hypothetical protein